MKLNRLQVCKEADLRLRVLKARTGLTPNILCRLGFCLSLNDPVPPDPAQYPEDGAREINRYTLTGPWDGLFVALLKERCQRDGVEEDGWQDQFRAHVNRGVLLLEKRVQNLEDLTHLGHQFRGHQPTSSGALKRPADNAKPVETG